MKNIKIVLLLLLGLPTVSSVCLGATESGDSIKIGGAFALTGAAAPFGNAEANAARLAVSEVNSKGGIFGRKLELILEDTQSSQLGTVNAVTKLISFDKVKLIVGPTWLDSFGGAIPIAERHKVVLISPSAVPAVMKKSPEQFPNVFSTFFDMGKELEFLLGNIAASGKKRVVLMFDQDPFYQWIHASLKAKALSSGLVIVEDISVPLGSTDLRTHFTKMEKKQVEAVLFGFVDSGALISFLKSRKTFIPGIQLFGIHDIEGYSADPAFQGLFSRTSYAVPAAASEAFRTTYTSEYKESPKLTASNAYDAVKIVAAILGRKDSTSNSFAKLLRAGEFETVSFGRVRFDALGGVDGGVFELKSIE